MAETANTTITSASLNDVQNSYNDLKAILTPLSDGTLTDKLDSIIESLSTGGNTASDLSLIIDDLSSLSEYIKGLNIDTNLSDIQSDIIEIKTLLNGITVNTTTKMLSQNISDLEFPNNTEALIFDQNVTGEIDCLGFTINAVSADDEPIIMSYNLYVDDELLISSRNSDSQSPIDEYSCYLAANGPKYEFLDSSSGRNSVKLSVKNNIKLYASWEYANETPTVELSNPMLNSTTSCLAYVK